MRPLKEYLVGPKTRERYRAALAEFFEWLAGRTAPMATDVVEFDSHVDEYIQWAYEEGHAKGDIGNLLSALSDLVPAFRGHMPTSWRALGGWRRMENQRAPTQCPS